MLLAPPPVVGLAVGHVAHRLPRPPVGVAVGCGHLARELLEEAELVGRQLGAPVVRVGEGQVVPPAVPVQDGQRLELLRHRADRLRLGLGECARPAELLRAAQVGRAQVVEGVLVAEVAVRVDAVVGAAAAARVPPVLALHPTAPRVRLRVPRVAVWVGDGHDQQLALRQQRDGLVVARRRLLHHVAHEGDDAHDSGWLARVHQRSVQRRGPRAQRVAPLQIGRHAEELDREPVVAVGDHLGGADVRRVHLREPPHLGLHLRWRVEPTHAAEQRRGPAALELPALDHCIRSSTCGKELARVGVDERRCRTALLESAPLDWARSKLNSAGVRLLVDGAGCCPRQSSHATGPRRLQAQERVRRGVLRRGPRVRHGAVTQR
mmetsp:Transcript_21864/g.51806  ORF Transcript_21864/g.51806 Transcript_21864/m.51806 type:complete len:378 (-) Transcript_21864:52-1185(-)